MSASVDRKAPEVLLGLAVPTVTREAKELKGQQALQEMRVPEVHREFRG